MYFFPRRVLLEITTCMFCKQCGESLGPDNRVLKEMGKRGPYYLNRCRPCLAEAAQILAKLRKLHPPPPVGTPCACCGRVDKLFLDHEHTSGKFRGWICKNCNVGLGHLGDCTAGVKRALEYLEERP